MGKQRKYTEEFKREAVRQLETRGDRSARDVAENLLYTWRRKYADVTEAVRAERGETPEEELKRLRREVHQLRRDKEILKKGSRLLREGNLMSAFEFVHAEKADYEVTELCRNLEVSTSGYYAWASRPASQRERDDERLRTKIRAVHERSRRTYGSPRIHAGLQEDDEKVSRKRVARLMKEDGISAVQKRRSRRTTDSAHNLPVAIDRVEREFSATAPNQLWVGDITYVWTAERWAYLAVLLDVFSRKVVGWALRKTLGRELVLAALDKALLLRDPPPPRPWLPIREP